jgi:catechol 2,3-dioxygenase-like lactoylglutathione lyase family enzyme
LAAPTIDRLDHLVLTVGSVDASVAFYTRVLGFARTTFGAGRTGLSFGSQKINLHAAESAIEPRAMWPTPGSADICFVTSAPIEDVIAHLDVCRVAIVAGPARRTGALGPMRSVYFRTPMAISSRLRATTERRRPPRCLNDQRRQTGAGTRSSGTGP